MTAPGRPAPGGGAAPATATPGDDPRALVTRHDLVLRPDPRRVITKLFVPGRELLIRGDSRADPVVRRLLAMPEDAVQAELGTILAFYAPRHHDFVGLLRERFAQIEPRFDDPEHLSEERRLLAAAIFTQEFAIETAALFNPSMVAHPDQAGCPEDWLRFVMSVRAVGEGHVSSIEFRTGMVGPQGQVVVDEPGPRTVSPQVIPTRYHKDVFVQHYGRRRPDGESAEFIFDRLPDEFDVADLDEVLHALRRQALTRGGVLGVIERFAWMAASSYSVAFPPDSALDERVIHPIGPAESHGMEDLRLTAYTDATGRRDFRGTYTAFSGDRVEPHLLRTDDFVTFHMSQLAGTAAANKGMALFPRPVGGQDLALSRWDRESNSLAIAQDLVRWEAGPTLEVPDLMWSLIQAGNCGPPIETDAGWLVLTHGVGAMRRYAIGALLLDRDDPARVVGRLAHPLLEAEGEEAVGYVPHVVYSCGGLAHAGHLVLPYGASDAVVRFASVELEPLLAALREGR
jgi:predicted GH43/DUF377 family glycosyl hydrolase